MQRAQNSYGAVFTAITLLLLATCLFLPYQAPFRQNNMMMMGVAMLFVLSFLMMHITLAGGMFLLYCSGILFFGSSLFIGTTIYLILCSAILFYAGVIAYPSLQFRKDWLYNSICIIVIINIIFAELQWYGYQAPHKLIYPIPSGLMGNPNDLSAILGMSLPMFFRKKWWVLIPAVILGFVLSQSLNGVVAGVLVSTIMIALKFKWKGFVAAALCATMMIGGYVYFIDRTHLKDPLNGRWRPFVVTEKIASVKLFGWGFGQYEFVMPLFTFAGAVPVARERQRAGYVTSLLMKIPDHGAVMRAVTKITGTKDREAASIYLKAQKNNEPVAFVQTHNEYLELRFATGIPGLLLGMLFLALSIRYGFIINDKLPVLGIMASASTALFFFPWQIMPSAILTILFLVLIYGEIKNHKRTGVIL